MKSLETTVYGKCILAGEHAVIRGLPALAVPVFGKALTLKYVDDGRPLSVIFEGEHGAELRLLFWGVIERAFEMTGHERQEATGHFDLSSSIPVGAGLGASATLCVAVGRWFAGRGWVRESELPEFCRQLENLFHGESSGLDIAVALKAKELRFERGKGVCLIEPLWKPRWYVSYSGKRGVTAECVQRVKALWKTDPASAERIDADMRDSVLELEEALCTPYSDLVFEQLAGAVRKAGSCFERWGLAAGEMGQHLRWLLDQGAYAVKPTGSGDGGYALSLWRKDPPSGVSGLIPV